MTIIPKADWPRREIYDFFAGMSHPFYTLTFPVDVTPLRAWCRREGMPFYPAMVYGVTKAMEKVEAFLYKDRAGQIVRVDRLVPSFTDLRPGSETFHIVTLEAGEDPALARNSFAARAAAMAPSTMPMISGRTYWTAAALCSPAAPAMSRRKQAMQKPMFFGFPAAVRTRAAMPTAAPVSRISP